MFKRIGRSVNKLLSGLGYQIGPLPQLFASGKDSRWIDRLDISTIIDIGSNEGQFIQKVSKELPGRKIYAFEPIASCYQKMIANTAGLNVTGFNVGLSASKGSSEINVSNNLVSSSLLDMKDLHKVSYPESNFTRKETIQLERLDDLLASEQIKGNLLIKMDVQGFEENVIKGGTDTFLKASVLIIESTFEAFYEGQWLFDDIYLHFSKNGFKFMGFADQVNSRKTGIPLYADAIFIRSDMVAKALM